MCGICGFCNYEENNATLAWREVGDKMGRTLEARGPDDKGLWQSNDCVLVHRRRRSTDAGRGHMPLVVGVNGQEYGLVLDGQLTNATALRRELANQGWPLEPVCDAQVLLYALIAWGEQAVERLEGAFAFAFWDGGRRRLVCARDALGSKPLYYVKQQGALVFASDCKALFAYPGLTPRLGRDGLCQLLGMGPAYAPDAGVFQGVEQLPPATILVVGPEGVAQRRYWQLQALPHQDSYPDTVQHVMQLVEGAVAKQINTQQSLCAFLSGGVSSSLLTALTARAYTREGRPPLNTYSFHYMDHQAHAAAHGDQEFAQVMARAYHTNHTQLQCDMPTLANLLGEATVARGVPGMAELDASLLHFCRQAARGNEVALSGEGADELFGGYPWLGERGSISNAFPWCPDLSLRRAVFNRQLWKQLAVEDYVQEQYQKALATCPQLEGERPLQIRQRELSYLAITAFLPCLLDRADRIGMAAGLEIRLPLCNRELAQYAFNIPYAMKDMNATPNQVLRCAARQLLPQPIANRAKSPYPVAQTGLYEQLVRARLATILDCPTAPLHTLINREQLVGQVMSGVGDAATPWFAQLLCRPQMMAYLIALNDWMEDFHLSI